VLSNRQIGAVGVSRVASALLRLGYSVLAPLEDFAGYDLVAEKNGRFTRIQVKTSCQKDPKKSRYGFMTSKGFGNKKTYPTNIIDYFVLYGMDHDLFWLVDAKSCGVVNYKANIKTGSSWRILSGL
jgi:hypothetical protein